MPVLSAPGRFLALVRERCMSQAPWQRAGPQGDPVGPLLAPWLPPPLHGPYPAALCLLHRAPADTPPAPCCPPLGTPMPGQDAGTSRSVSSLSLWRLAGPYRHSCTVEGAVRGSCSASARAEGISEAQLLLPLVLLDSFALGQPVLPRSFLSACPLGSLPMLVPLAG